MDCLNYCLNENKTVDIKDCKENCKWYNYCKGRSGQCPFLIMDKILSSLKIQDQYLIKRKFYLDEKSKRYEDIAIELYIPLCEIEQKINNIICHLRNSKKIRSCIDYNLLFFLVYSEFSIRISEERNWRKYTKSTLKYIPHTYTLDKYFEEINTSIEKLPLSKNIIETLKNNQIYYVYDLIQTNHISLIKNVFPNDAFSLASLYSTLYNFGLGYKVDGYSIPNSSKDNFNMILENVKKDYQQLFSLLKKSTNLLETCIVARSSLIELNDLDLPIRVLNCLHHNAGLNTLFDLLNKTEADMLKIRNLGRKSIDIIKNKLHNLGLDFLSEGSKAIDCMCAIPKIENDYIEELKTDYLYVCDNCGIAFEINKDNCNLYCEKCNNKLKNLVDKIGYRIFIGYDDVFDYTTFRIVNLTNEVVTVDISDIWIHYSGSDYNKAKCIIDDSPTLLPFTDKKIIELDVEELEKYEESGAYIVIETQDAYIKFSFNGIEWVYDSFYLNK